MNYGKFMAVILLSGTLAAQNTKLSHGARKLLNRPRRGNAEVTFIDGTTQRGRVVRVTDQFIAIETNRKPRACQSVDLSKISEVQWLEPHARRSEARDMILGGAIVGPFLIADAIGQSLKRASPPLNPPTDSWELRGKRAGVQGTLKFDDNKVEERTTFLKRGRWSIDQNRLNLAIEGEPDSSTPFHFDCDHLELDHPSVELRDTMSQSRAEAPIVGRWCGSSLCLDLKLDGSVLQEKRETRQGTFEHNASGVTIHWTDPAGLGGADWVLQIQDRHLVGVIGGLNLLYTYVRPSRLDL